MDNFNEKDLEFLHQGELFYSGSQPTWSDLEWDTYRKDVFEPKYGDVTNYMKSLKLGQHVDHRASGRFRLHKISITKEFSEFCKDKISTGINSYWMYKYDGCSLVAYYNNGKLVQVCTKSAVEWGIDRTKMLGWLFPEVVDPSIDSIQGEAVVKVSEVGGEYAARSKANGLINSKYKSDEVNSLIHVRAFKVGFTDLDENIGRMINALKSLPIPNHGKFQIARNLTLDDITSNPIGTEDILYDGIVEYNPVNNSITGYKRHADEHLVTKVTNIEWNLSDKGLLVPKFEFEEVVFNAVYNDEGNIVGGIHVRRASCGSANRLFSMKAGAGAIVEVYRANSTIPQVSRVITPAEDYCLTCIDDRYYEEGYEFGCGRNPWEVIGNKGYYCTGAGIRNADSTPNNMKSSIEYWWGLKGWLDTKDSNPIQSIKFVYYKSPITKFIKSISGNEITEYMNRLLSGDPDEFDKVTNELIDRMNAEKIRNSMVGVKDEFLSLVKCLKDEGLI